MHKIEIMIDTISRIEEGNDSESMGLNSDGSRSYEAACELIGKRIVKRICSMTRTDQKIMALESYLEKWVNLRSSRVEKTFLLEAINCDLSKVIKIDE